jgi:hypothetical protein
VDGSKSVTTGPSVILVKVGSTLSVATWLVTEPDELETTTS